MTPMLPSRDGENSLAHLEGNGWEDNFTHIPSNLIPYSMGLSSIIFSHLARGQAQ